MQCVTKTKLLCTATLCSRAVFVRDCLQIADNKRPKMVICTDFNPDQDSNLILLQRLPWSRLVVIMFFAVCASVYLGVCQQDLSKSCQQILMKFLRGGICDQQQVIRFW